MRNNPIFIFGSHKSGTSLMRSLLDGHTDLFVVPIEAHFFQYSGFWVDYALRKSWPEILAFDEVIENLTCHIRHEQEKTIATSRTSDSVLSGHWDVDRFRNHLRDNCHVIRDNDYQKIMDCYVDAISISLFGSLPRADRFVEKSVENAEYAVFLKKLYPKAKIIHMVRNPYATLVSLRNHMGKNQYPNLGKALSSLENSFYYLYKNQLILDDYKVVRYEDLLTYPREMMEEIARFIEITFDDILLEPTVLGNQWQGNSSSGLQFEGISLQPLTDWQQKIVSLEVAFVNKLFPFVLRDYNYERMPVDGLIYKPIRKEKLKVYLANRLLWKMTSTRL